MTARTVVASKIRARTYAKGLLAALAHDLELDLPASESTVEQLDDGAWSGRIVVAVDAIRVVGVLRRGAVATDVLSASDRTEIEKRLRQACAPETTLVVTARGRVNAEGTADRAARDAMRCVRHDQLGDGSRRELPVLAMADRISVSAWMFRR